jgi:NAD(P)-dependent dehydrogenase (short-subunit alcohol dehydrogenase family)
VSASTGNGEATRRRLAEAGLRTVAGRGKSAAKVNADDAANLLIAILGSPAFGPSIKSAQQTCESFASLSHREEADFTKTQQKIKNFGLSSFAHLPPGHTFRCALATLIHGASRGELFRIPDFDGVLVQADSCFAVNVSTIHQAEISFTGHLVSPTPKKDGLLIYFPESELSIRRGLQESRSINYYTLRSLGRLMATTESEDAGS